MTVYSTLYLYPLPCIQLLWSEFVVLNIWCYWGLLWTIIPCDS